MRSWNQILAKSQSVWIFWLNIRICCLNIQSVFIVKLWTILENVLCDRRFASWPPPPSQVCCVHYLCMSSSNWTWPVFLTNVSSSLYFLVSYIYTYIYREGGGKRSVLVCVKKKKKSYCARVNFYMILLFVCRHSRPLVWDHSTWSRLFPHWSVCGHLQLRQPVWQRLKEKTPAWNGHAVPARYQTLSHEC